MKLATETLQSLVNQNIQFESKRKNKDPIKLMHVIQGARKAELWPLISNISDYLVISTPTTRPNDIKGEIAQNPGRKREMSEKCNKSLQDDGDFHHTEFFGQRMKVVLVGDTQVGKTCILNRLVTNTFNQMNSATVGAAFQTHVVSTPAGCVTMQIWDTAGQEKFRALAPMYYRSADVAIMVFDLTNPESFSAVEKWAEELTDKAPSGLQTILVGNKNDLTEQRRIDKKDAEELAFKHGATEYFECSARTGNGVVEIFTKVAELGGPAVAQKQERETSPTVTSSNYNSAQSGGSSCSC